MGGAVVTARPDWRTHTPAEVLDGNLVLTLTQVAYILGLSVAKGARKGEPNLRAAAELVHTGRLRAVDPHQPVGKCTVSAASVRRYLAAADTPTFSLVKESA